MIPSPTNPSFITITVLLPLEQFRYCAEYCSVMANMATVGFAYLERTEKTRHRHAEKKPDAQRVIRRRKRPRAVGHVSVPAEVHGPAHQRLQQRHAEKHAG